MIRESLSSKLARQPLVGPGLLKKLCPFVPVEGDILPILNHLVFSYDKRTPKRILQWKPIGTRTRGRPRKRWIAGTEEDLQIMGVRRMDKAM
jgi:hypothetical protein